MLLEIFPVVPSEVQAAPVDDRADKSRILIASFRPTCRRASGLRLGQNVPDPPSNPEPLLLIPAAIPVERQVRCARGFTFDAVWARGIGVGSVVKEGAVYDIDHPVVSRFPEFFVHVERPVLPEEVNEDGKAET